MDPEFMKKNPKTHDSLFKWLIASFTRDFFTHFFPDITIGRYRFIDKEFIRKYEALKESLKDDLFLLIEIEIDGFLQDVVIQIEHKSKRENVVERMFEYLCYAWLLKKRPVWSIVIYTDKAIWRKKIPDFFWYAFSDKKKKQYCHFDVIKVKDEKSVDLLKKRSLMCKLLALNADDRGMDVEKAIYEIYRAMRETELTNDQKLLIEQWLQAYKKVPDEIHERIKKEVKMTFVATTISEHIHNEGKMEGIVEGELKGELNAFEKLYDLGILTKKQFEAMAAPLREKLRTLSQPENKREDDETVH